MTNCCRQLPTRWSGATGVTERCRRLFTEFGCELRSRAGWRWICNEINMPRHARKRSLAYTEHEHDPRIVNFLATESNFEHGLSGRDYPSERRLFVLLAPCLGMVQNVTRGAAQGKGTST